MEEETSLRELLEIIFAGKWIILGFTLITLLLTGIVTFFLVEPKYEAKTVLLFIIQFNKFRRIIVTPVD